jgi:hypothetical protein
MRCAHAQYSETGDCCADCGMRWHDVVSDKLGRRVEVLTRERDEARAEVRRLRRALSAIAKYDARGAEGVSLANCATAALSRASTKAKRKGGAK